MIKEDRRYRSPLPFPGLKGDFSLLSTDRINKDNCFATGLWPGAAFPYILFLYLLPLPALSS